jgi:hypothetical protein
MPVPDYIRDEEYRGDPDYSATAFVIMIVVLGLMAIAGLIVYATRPVQQSPTLERYSYMPGHLVNACTIDTGPVWMQLQRDLEEMRQRRDDSTSVAIITNTR